MSFLPANTPAPVIKPVPTSYVVEQSEVAVEGSIQTHPLAPPPLGVVRAGVSRTPVRSTPAIEPSSPSMSSHTPQDTNLSNVGKTRSVVPHENDVRPEGNQGSPSCQKQELNHALATPLPNPLVKSTRGVVKPAKKIARVRRTLSASTQLMPRRPGNPSTPCMPPETSSPSTALTPRRTWRSSTALTPRRTWNSSTGVMPRRPLSASTGVMPLNQTSGVQSTALVPYKKETALVPYKKPSPNLRANVAPVFKQLGPVFKDIVFSLAAEQLPEICCPALPVVPRGPAYKATRSGMLSSTTFNMVSASRANHFQQARKTAAQIIAGKGYTVTQSSTQPSTQPTRVLQTFKNGALAATPMMSGVYVAQADIVAAVTRYHHEQPYLVRQTKVAECIEKKGQMVTDFNRNLKNIHTVFEQINEAFNSPEALNQEHALPKLIFATTNPNEASPNPPSCETLSQFHCKKLNDKLAEEVSLRQQVVQAEPGEHRTLLRGALQNVVEERLALQTLVFSQGQPQHVWIGQVQEQTFRPAFLALMNQQCDQVAKVLPQKMHIYENQGQVVPVKYILGLDQEVFESVDKISQTLNEILIPAKEHKAALQRQPQITNQPTYTAYEMQAEAVHQLEESIAKFANVLKTFEANIDNTNTQCEDFEIFDRDVTAAIQAVAQSNTVDAKNMQTYDDFFVRDVEANEQDWRQMPAYHVLKGRLDSFIHTDDDTKLAIISVHRNKPFVVVNAHPPGRGIKSGLIKGSITGGLVYGIRAFAPGPIRWAVQKCRDPLPKDLPQHQAFFAKLGRTMIGTIGGAGAAATLYGVHIAMKSFQCAQNVRHWHSILTSAEKFFTTAEGRKLQQEIYANFAKSLFNGGAGPVNPPGPPGAGG